MSLFLALTMMLSLSTTAFAAETFEYNQISSMEIPVEFYGVDLFSTNFDVNQMTDTEKNFFNFLLEKEADRYLSDYDSSESKEQVIDDIQSIITEGLNSPINSSTTTAMYAAPWWHLNTVGKVGSAINILISAALATVGGGIASGGIRALIAKVGEQEAKKIVKNVVVNKVKNTLIAWGMSGMANKISNSLLTSLMWLADPGTAIAEWLDKHDAKPNNGYIEAW